MSKLCKLCRAHKLYHKILKTNIFVQNREIMGRVVSRSQIRFLS